MVSLAIGRLKGLGWVSMINLLFFGRLGDLAQNVDHSIVYDGQLRTPKELVHELEVAHPRLVAALREPQVLVSVNKMVVKWDHPLFDGDEIAFLPPVTGG